MAWYGSRYAAHCAVRRGLRAHRSEKAPLPAAPRELSAARRQPEEARPPEGSGARAAGRPREVLQRSHTRRAARDSARAKGVCGQCVGGEPGMARGTMVVGGLTSCRQHACHNITSYYYTTIHTATTTTTTTTTTTIMKAATGILLLLYYYYCSQDGEPRTAVIRCRGLSFRGGRSEALAATIQEPGCGRSPSGRPRGRNREL